VNDDPRRDIHLMGRIAAGDRDAFAELFDRLAPTVLGVLGRALGGRAEAEEVLQEVFLQVWRDAGRYLPERATPRGWVLMLARSRALDRLRSGRASRAREEAVAAREGRAGAEPPVAPVGTDRLEADERAGRVRSALAGLPDEQRRCIELAFYDGLTQAEIARRLGAPLGTVKSRLLLGMRKLRLALAN
jgi:RNA polymerase sigma-70 factor (ECF subfamily)